MDCRTMKRHCSSSLHTIDDLPSNIIQSILKLLPLRDMVRTSVLSKNWRSHWVTIPQLVIEDNLRMIRYGDSSIGSMHIVFGILLLHQGPILKFKLNMSRWRSCCCSDINKIIPLLSRNGIEDLTFVTGGLHLSDEEESDDDHTECDELPSSIFSCSELKHLSLTRCVFYPLTLVGFKKLISIELINIDMNRNVVIPCGPLLDTMKLETYSHIESFSVDAPNLKTLWLNGYISYIDFTKTPLLKVLSLRGRDHRTLDFNKLLPSLPRLENMYLSNNFHKFLVPNEVQSLSNNLRILELSGFDVKDMAQLSSALLWIRSQPNLHKLKFTDVWPSYWRKSKLNFQKLLYCDYSLMKLRELEFDFIDNMRPCVEFIKFLLTISPELETLSIRPPYGIEVVDNPKILFELACSRRASSKAEVVCFDLDWNMM